MQRILSILFLFLASGTLVYADNGMITLKSSNSVTVTIDRLENILAKKGMTVFARVDHAAGAGKAGLDLRPTQLLIFGNPQVGTRLMQSNQAAAIDLPMKALAWEDNDGQVWLAYSTPAYLVERHHITDREEIVQKMTGALRKFTSYAAEAPEEVPLLDGY